MGKAATGGRVSIRPGVSVLSVLRHLNYRPWFALAEFVDNSLQSYLDYRKQLEQAESQSFKLNVQIDIESATQRIVVTDNAAGIHKQDFPRAFRPAELPPDSSGLCEFGMGMKSAACWFSPKWCVRTSALGEPVAKTVAFDVARIVKDEIEELDVAARSVRKGAHFTSISLEDLHRLPVKRTLSKIKDHLRDIYRVFMREGLMTLTVNGDELEYKEPPILVAPHYRDTKGRAKRWRKDIDFDFGEGLRAHGFVAIRKTASTAHAGFALFRRHRLIQGSGDEGYRPALIFGRPNSYEYQRIFGELHLEGFEVTHTKDGFKWDENEEPFLQLLKAEMSKKEFPLLQQARHHRVRRRRKEWKKGAEEAAKRTSEAIKKNVPDALGKLSEQTSAVETPEALAEAETVSHRMIDLEFMGQAWRIILELTTDPSVEDWYELSDRVLRDAPSNGRADRRLVGLRLSLTHPFMEQFSGPDPEQIEPLLRVAAALGLAEVAARDTGVRYTGVIRRNVNELLKNALSRP